MVKTTRYCDIYGTPDALELVFESSDYDLDPADAKMVYRDTRVDLSHKAAVEILDCLLHGLRLDLKVRKAMENIIENKKKKSA